MVTSTACLKASMSNSSSALRNFMRFRDAKLQAESSRYIYSEHGLEELMRAVLELVCHLLIMVSYCMPGSPQIQVDSAIMRSRSLPLKESWALPPFRVLVARGRRFGPAAWTRSSRGWEGLRFWIGRGP